MRLRLVLLAVWLSAVAGSAANQPAVLPIVRLYGHEFVDLGAWAKANSLRITWDRTSRQVHLTNRWNRLLFNAGSRLAELNGVKIWLSIPITQANDGLYLSVIDRRTLLQPILVPPRNPGGQKVRRIALDPGHGGRDAGYEVGQHQEKTYTLLLARKLRHLLEAAGFRVMLTRNDDTYVERDERAAKAKRFRADLFVSLHFNASAQGGNDAQGVEVYCITPAGVSSTNGSVDDGLSTRAVRGNLHNARSVLLGYQLQKAILRNIGAEDRGLRRARFEVLREADMPAVLVEGGFLSAPQEAKRITLPQPRDELAKAIVDGILAYKRLVERQ